MTKMYRKWLLFVACACLCLAALTILKAFKRNAGVYAMKEASYPTMASYPNNSDSLFYDKKVMAWQNDRKKQISLANDCEHGIDRFFSLTMKQFLSATNHQNCVCSPVNLYIALGMLAETSQQDSRDQILDALQAKNIETVRAHVKAMWNANYCNDGDVVSVLANSIWLDQGCQYRKDVVNILANDYYASSYQGKMGSGKMNQAMQNWVNAQTGGLLEKQASKIKPNTGNAVLSLLSTFSYQAGWSKEFKVENTKKDCFHGVNQDIICDFMNGIDNAYIYQTDKFTAAPKFLSKAGVDFSLAHASLTDDLNCEYIMWFVLPKETVSLDELLQDDSILAFIMDKDWRQKCETAAVQFSIPKFDVSWQSDLKDGLKNMGILDVFDEREADFSSLLENSDGVFLGKTLQTMRVGIDEAGCFAAAYTEMELLIKSSEDNENSVQFRLDRPFLFFITGPDHLPLAAGAINQP